MGIEMYLLAFLVIATGYLMVIRGDKKQPPLAWPLGGYFSF